MENKQINKGDDPHNEYEIPQKEDDPTWMRKPQTQQLHSNQTSEDNDKQTETEQRTTRDHYCGAGDHHGGAGDHSGSGSDGDDCKWADRGFRNSHLNGSGKFRNGLFGHDKENREYGLLGDDGDGV